MRRLTRYRATWSDGKSLIVHARHRADAWGVAESLAGPPGARLVQVELEDFLVCPQTSAGVHVDRIDPRRGVADPSRPDLSRDQAVSDPVSHRASDCRTPVAADGESKEL